MKKIILSILILSAFSSFATPESDKEICGDLIYMQGNYVLQADHGDTYFVREEKLSRSSTALTSLMRIIVVNHDYEESDYPRVCFYKVLSVRVEENKLDVLEISDVKEQESVY